MCVNEKCNNSTDTLTRVLMTWDGDFACCQACADEYIKQRDHFFNTTIHSEQLTKDFLNGE